MSNDRYEKIRKALAKGPMQGPWGATLRDLLAERDALAAEVEALRAERDALAHSAFKTADRAWEAEYVRQRYIQWPAAWADAMLKAREAGND
jgi:hypothetical protein